MNKTFVWFCGPSACGKTWLSDKCRANLDLCKQLGFPAADPSAIGVVTKLENAHQTDSLAEGQNPITFIHWQTCYDRDGYGVQRLMEKAPDAMHVVVEIHRDPAERWLDFQQKQFSGQTEELALSRFVKWPKTDYEEIRKHLGIVTRYIRVFLAGNAVFLIEPVD